MSDLVTISSPDSADAEAYRGLRANLLAARGDSKVLLIASPAPGAGAAETAANLAVVCAQGGLRVILVDADLASPTLHRLLDVPNGDGFADALSGGAVEPAGTVVAGLRLVVAGSELAPARTTALRASDLFSRPTAGNVIEAFRESADLVIALAPPVLTAADAATLARHVDSVVLVLAVGQSRRDDAAAARAAFDQVGAPVLGVVLTGIGQTEAPFRYYRRLTATQ